MLGESSLYLDVVNSYIIGDILAILILLWTDGDIPHPPGYLSVWKTWLGFQTPSFQLEEKYL